MKKFFCHWKKLLLVGRDVQDPCLSRRLILCHCGLVKEMQDSQDWKLFNGILTPISDEKEARKTALVLQQLLYWIFSGACFQSTKSWSLELILITKAVFSPHRYKPPLWSTFGVGRDSTQNLLKKLAFWIIRHICTLWLAYRHRNLLKHLQIAKLNHYGLI